MDKLEKFTDENIKEIWDDDKEPKILGMTRTFHVAMPVEGKSLGASHVWARVEVDQHDYCELVNWCFFGHRPKRDGTGYFLNKPEDALLWEAMQHVWTWLAEWEYVELRPIGPEDSEYFATDKLKEGKVESDNGYPG